MSKILVMNITERLLNQDVDHFLRHIVIFNDIDIPIYNLISYNFEHLDGHGLNNVQ